MGCCCGTNKGDENKNSSNSNNAGNGTGGNSKAKEPNPENIAVKILSKNVEEEQEDFGAGSDEKKQFMKQQSNDSGDHKEKENCFKISPWKVKKFRESLSEFDKNERIDFDKFSELCEGIWDSTNASKIFYQVKTGSGSSGSYVGSLNNDGTTTIGEIRNFLDSLNNATFFATERERYLTADSSGNLEGKVRPNDRVSVDGDRWIITRTGSVQDGSGHPVVTLQTETTQDDNPEEKYLRIRQRRNTDPPRPRYIVILDTETNATRFRERPVSSDDDTDDIYRYQSVDQIGGQRRYPAVTEDGSVRVSTAGGDQTKFQKEFVVEL